MDQTASKAACVLTGLVTMWAAGEAEAVTPGYDVDRKVGVAVTGEVNTTMPLERVYLVISGYSYNGRTHTDVGLVDLGPAPTGLSAIDVPEVIRTLEYKFSYPVNPRTSVTLLAAHGAGGVVVGSADTNYVRQLKDINFTFAEVCVTGGGRPPPPDGTYTRQSVHDAVVAGNTAFLLPFVSNHQTGRPPYYLPYMQFDVHGTRVTVPYSAAPMVLDGTGTLELLDLPEYGRATTVGSARIDQRVAAQSGVVPEPGAAVALFFGLPLLRRQRR